MANVPRQQQPVAPLAHMPSVRHVPRVAHLTKVLVHLTHVAVQPRCVSVFVIVVGEKPLGVPAVDVHVLPLACRRDGGIGYLENNQNASDTFFYDPATVKHGDGGLGFNPIVHSKFSTEKIDLPPYVQQYYQSYYYQYYNQNQINVT